MDHELHKRDVSSTLHSSPEEKRMPSAGFPHGYALIVGISSYADRRLKLSAAPLKDAMGVHTVLRKAEYCGYQDRHVELLINHEATAENIRQKLKWLAEITAMDKNATVIFYFSGHGGRIDIDGQVSHYLLPFDCDLNNLDSTAITSTEFAQLLHTIRPPRLLVLLDNCYAGGIDDIKGTIAEQSALKYGPEEDYYHQLAHGHGRVIIASSGPEEVSRSWSTLNNSLFTHYLLKALQGEAPTLSLGDGLIRVSELFSYLDAQIPKDRPQHPVMTTQKMENFPVALYQGSKRVQFHQEPEKAHGNSEEHIGHTEEYIDPIKLREAIVSAFSLEEFKTLCADIAEERLKNGINEPFSFDTLPGDGLTSKARELVMYFQRRHQLNYVVKAVRKQRSHLNI